MEYASAELKADRDVVLAAVAQDRVALKFASAELRADRGFVLAAVAEDGMALEYASDELRRDPQLIIKAGLQIANFSSAKSKDQSASQRVNDYINKINLPQFVGACIEHLYIGKDQLHTKICQKIAEYRNREIGFKLLIDYSQHFQNPEFVQTYKELSCKLADSNPLVPVMLPSIYPSLWSQGLLKSGQASSPVNILREFFHKEGNRKFFKNIKYPLTQNFLLASVWLDKMCANGQLQAIDALNLLAKACQSYEPAQTLIALANVSNQALAKPLLHTVLFTEGVLIQEQLSAKSINSLVIKRVSHLLPGLKDIPEEEFIQRYESTFALTTIPNALLTYIIGIGQLTDVEDVKKDLERFIRNVLFGSTQIIYDTGQNPTLHKIKQTAPDVLDRWKQILPNTEHAGYICRELEDPLERFNAMTSGNRTCQSVDSQGRNKLALVSLSEDGDIHVFEVQDPNQNKVAKFVMRFFVNTQDRPALFLKPVYTIDPSNISIHQCAEKAALAKAHQLGICLYTKNCVYNSQFKHVEGKLHYLGGRCSMTYLDSGKGLVNAKTTHKIEMPLKQYTIASWFAPRQLNSLSCLLSCGIKRLFSFYY
ncbi:MAG: DUF4116 domain-containing protein [Alphaproteobacteria bacterium]|nr:DUF4116 domain-containing protein [Alphaproteobacteria bacterium]